MIAKNLTITKLHGYLDKKIDFNKDINLLVGINGSGKTSVLNVLNWLLTPSLANLAINEFEKLELTFSYKERDYEISVTQDEQILTYSITELNSNRQFYPLTVRLKTPPSRLGQNEKQKEKLYKEYMSLGPDKEEIGTWAFIYNELPKPVIIGLDRHLFSEEKNNVLVYDDNINGYTIKENIGKSSPLDEIKKLANREYSIYKNKLVDLNKTLNNKIMLSAFEEITPSSLEELENISNISLEQIEGLHKKVETFFKENINEVTRKGKIKNNSLNKIESYFNNLKKVISEGEKNKYDNKFTLLYISNISQFKKLREFIKEFEDFDKKSGEYYLEIKTYLETINKFLFDSSKQLSFQKALSELVFNVIDKEGKIVSKNRDINSLSSGEKQILILLTYLKYHNKAGTIFIIDEPELSLHPKWQEEFLNAVKVLTPKTTQIIIATHSPIIVGTNLNYCKVLLPYND